MSVHWNGTAQQSAIYVSSDFSSHNMQGDKQMLSAQLSSNFRSGCFCVADPVPHPEAPHTNILGVGDLVDFDHGVFYANDPTNGTLGDPAPLAPVIDLLVDYGDPIGLTMRSCVTLARIDRVLGEALHTTAPAPAPITPDPVLCESCANCADHLPDPGAPGVCLNYANYLLDCRMCCFEGHPVPDYDPDLEIDWSYDPAPDPDLGELSDLELFHDYGKHPDGSDLFPEAPAPSTQTDPGAVVYCDLVGGLVPSDQCTCAQIWAPTHPDVDHCTVCEVCTLDRGVWCGTCDHNPSYAGCPEAPAPTPAPAPAYTAPRDWCLTCNFSRFGAYHDPDRCRLCVHYVDLATMYTPAPSTQTDPAPSTPTDPAPSTRSGCDYCANVCSGCFFVPDPVLCAGCPEAPAPTPAPRVKWRDLVNKLAQMAIGTQKHPDRHPDGTHGTVTAR